MAELTSELDGTSRLPPTVTWVDGAVELIDQTALPHSLEILRISDVAELIAAIQRLSVRGAPALGVVGAYGAALAVRQARSEGWTNEALAASLEALAAARPTAVNLRWGVEQVLPAVAAGPEAALGAATGVRDADVRDGELLGVRGADWLEERLAAVCGSRPFRVQTHCNAGGLACAQVGSALAIVFVLARRGRIDRVHVDETRPLLQGSRLTAFELGAQGIDYRIQPDGAGASAVRLGLVDCVVIGADRIAANGDVCNKVGSYPLALAAARAGIPFVVAAPEPTIDAATPDGTSIEIEERGADEILFVGGRRVAPTDARAWNPAFDVTPADLIDAIVTERRVLRPSAGERP